MPRAKQDSAEDAILEELFAFYRRVDASYEGSHCPSSTECCRFGLTGREPYVTSVEVAALRRAVSRRGGWPSAKRRAVPMTTTAAAERTCPFLDALGRCSVYESRPLGCRTFYCSRATVTVRPGGAEQRELVNRLRDIASRHEPGGDAPRPLSRVFAEKG
jgi:Fe-S-cluster containining protein